jgi:class 3 adenylate cyclase
MVRGRERRGGRAFDFGQKLMADPLRKLADFLLYVPDTLTGEDARQYMFFRIGAWVATATHASWVIVFALNGVALVAWYNVVVTALFAFSGHTWRDRRGPMWFMLTLYLIEIPLHGFLGTLFTGLETMFWLMGFIATIPCLIAPQLSWRTKFVLSGVITAFCCACAVFALSLQPLTPFPVAWVVYLLVSNVLSVSSAFVLYLGLNQYSVLIAEQRLTEEFDRAEGLLRNILPDPIALRLKDGERVIANEHREVSVIFADIVDFTAASAKLTPGELVETLNLVFSEFDTIADKYGAEKIKTIGDAYMVVVGVPDANDNHAKVAVDLARDMLHAADALSERAHFDVRLRIGINSGPVVAGVIGKRKFAYDLWGDAVNVASRMESHGTPGKILVTEETARLLPPGFPITPEGSRDVKGKGATPVFGIAAADNRADEQDKVQRQVDGSRTPAVSKPLEKS